MSSNTGKDDGPRSPGGKRGGGKRGVIIQALILAAAILLLGQVVGANAVSPGSEGDPLVTASWVENRLASYFRNTDSVSGQPAGPQISSSVYELVVLPAGAKLLTGTGTEFILRSGKARSIAADGGGIADLTSGKDMGNRETIVRNHLLLSPKEDGRGASMDTESIFLIRGPYTTEE